MNDRNITWLKKNNPEPDATSPQVRQTVEDIVNAVRSRGMDAIQEYAVKFDGFGGPFAVSPKEAKAALDELAPDNRKALEMSIRNVRKFHALQKEALKDHEWELSPGVHAGFRYVPMESTAVYVPGGRYPLTSSAIMCVVPAQEAGVRRIAAFSPPGKDGKINKTVLATLALLEIEEIWAIGGVQAIAALALGTDEIEKVDFVAGPGNAYVSEAKRVLFGHVGIDGIAGPSEVLILADESADYKLIARDLLAQSEHDPMARGILIATSRALAENVSGELNTLLPDLPTKEVAELSWSRNGAIGLADSLDEAIAYANEAAPEHLQLAVANPREALAKCTAYGAAFLGYSSSEVFGDYIAGTNHTLPTSARAKFSGGLWTGSFLRTLTHLDLTPAGAADLAEAGAVIARTEGLEAHARALLARKEKFGK